MRKKEREWRDSVVRFADATTKLVLSLADAQAEYARLRAEITRLESLISAPRECPTNHTTTKMPMRGQIIILPTEWRSVHSDMRFCPDCGTPLSAGSEE